MKNKMEFIALIRHRISENIFNADHYFYINEELIEKAALFFMSLENLPNSNKFTIFVDPAENSQIQFQIFNDISNRKLSFFINGDKIKYIKIFNNSIKDMEDGILENETSLVELWNWFVC